MNLPIGEIAALGTALCWSFSSILFTFVAQRIGAVGINRMRLTFAILFLFAFHKLFLGEFIPSDLSLSGWSWLGMSGVVGLIVGDSFMYQGFRVFGPRKTILVASSTPIFSAILALFFLGEKLGHLQWTGIILTVAGIAWVVGFQASNNGEKKSGNNNFTGTFMGAGAAISQAVSLVLVRKGMEEGVSILSVTLVRMLVAVVLLWLISLLRGKVIVHLKTVMNREILLRLSTGSFIGPFVGIFLSMIAIERAPVGVASAIMAVQPILMIPMAKFLLKDSPGHRGLWGAIFAALGTAILFLSAP